MPIQRGAAIRVAAAACLPSVVLTPPWRSARRKIDRLNLRTQFPRLQSVVTSR